MNDTLQNTLDDLLRSGSESNPALNTLLSDYGTYHLVLAVIAALFLVSLSILAVWLWRRFRASRRHDTRRWSFESRTFFGFGVLSVALALFMGLIVTANVSNAVDPRQGFSGAVALLNTPPPDTQTATVHAAVNAWLKSDADVVPTPLQTRVAERLAWQRPKAVISASLLVMFVVVGARTWRRLLNKSRRPTKRTGLGDAALLATGVVAVGACLVLMLMVMGNSQASLAPLSLTLFYG